MAVKCGIIGLPGAGKSLLFNAMTKGNAASGNYLFCTTSATAGTVSVPDGRLASLAKIARPNSITHATQEFVDIPGLVRGSSRGEGLGNSFLAEMRDMNAIAHVVRCFENPDMPHPEGALGPLRDLDIIEMELLLKDIEVVEKSIERHQKTACSGNKESQALVAALEKALAGLNTGKLASAVELDSHEQQLLKSYCLLTQKPMLLVGNISESDIVNPLGNPFYEELEKTAAKREIPIMAICARLEADLAQMASDEQALFMEEAGLCESGLGRFIRACYSLLSLQTFFTTASKQLRAWTLPIGSTVRQAAGAIHSDFERGFIRAKVISYNDYLELNGESGAKEAGKQRVEGKGYVVNDGDVIEFLFNV